jgi:hypothetical protein
MSQAILLAVWAIFCAFLKDQKNPQTCIAALTGKPGLAAFRKRGGAAGAGAGRRRMGLRAFGGGSSSESSGGSDDNDEEAEKSEDDAVSGNLITCTWPSGKCRNKHALRQNKVGRF